MVRLIAATFLGLASGLCLSGATAPAQETPVQEMERDSPAIAELYRQYLAALEEGDLDGAQAVASLAYERALSEWGREDIQTGYLAGNYAELLRRQGATQQAAEVYRTCAEVLSGFVEEAAVDLANCHFYGASLAAGDSRMRPARQGWEAVTALAGHAGEDTFFNGLVGQSYLELAGDAVPDRVRMGTIDSDVSRRFEQARDYAQAALPYLARSYGAVSAPSAQAEMLIAFYHEFGQDWAGAYQHYRRAFDIYAQLYGHDDQNTRTAYGRAKYADMRGGGELQQAPYGNEPAHWADLDPDSEALEIAQLENRNAPCTNENIRNGEAVTVCLIRRRAPDYPEIANMNGMFGYAEVRFDIAEDGSTDNIRIYTSWPEGAFEKAIVEAVEDWKYTPPVTADGETVRYGDVVTWFMFRL